MRISLEFNRRSIELGINDNKFYCFFFRPYAPYFINSNGIAEKTKRFCFISFNLAFELANSTIKRYWPLPHIKSPRDEEAQWWLKNFKDKCCTCSEKATVECSWLITHDKEKERHQKASFCTKHAEEFWKAWGQTSSGQSAVWRSLQDKSVRDVTFEDLHKSLLNEYKKGTIMNDQITQDMALAHQEPLPPVPVKEVEGQEATFIQTEGDVGTESPETRIN